VPAGDDCSLPSASKFPTMHWPLCSAPPYSSMEAESWGVGWMRKLTRRHNDDDQQDDDADNDAHAHLHVLPPHLLADAIRAATETVRLRRQRIGPVLQLVQVRATLVALDDVLPHLVDRGIDLLYIV